MAHRRTVIRALSFLLAGFLVHAPGVAEGTNFDVASVKLLGPDIPRVPIFSGGPGSDSPGRLHLRVNMSLLIGAAFGASADQIQGPEWLRDSAIPFYEIMATMPPATTKKGTERMLQNLLVERFHLRFHHETGNCPGYELVLDPGGPALEPVVPHSGPDGFPVPPDPRTSGRRDGNGHQRNQYQERSMGDLAKHLGFQVGRALGRPVDAGYFQPRVVDKTGLPGTYSFILEYDCPGCVAPAAPPTVDADGGGGFARLAPVPGDFPDLFGALKRQLGLKLVKTKDVVVDIIVVESVDRTPTEN